MKTIVLTRENGQFVTEEVIRNRWGYRVAARLCCSVTTRLFELRPGSPSCTAVFTKTKPRTEGRYYAINKRKSIFGD